MIRYAAALALLPSLAWAQTDGILHTSCKPDTRTTITGVINQPTDIGFPKGVSVYRIVQTEIPVPGDPDKTEAPWQAPTDAKEHPLGSHVTLWPHHEGVSLLTIVTVASDGVTQGSCAFRLVAKPASVSLDLPGLVFNVIVDGTDPVVAAEHVQAQRSAWVEKREAAKREAAVARIRTTALTASITHCHYMAQGQHVSFEPKCPATNGQWVWFHFPGQIKKPSIEVVDADLKTTRVPRQHAVGDFIVVEEYAKRFRLIMGQEVLDIFDTDFNAEGADPGTGTISPAVTRELIQAQK